MAAGNIAKFQRLALWRDQFERTISQFAPTQIFGQKAERLANTSCLTMPGVLSETQVMGLDLAGIAVSAGSACSSGKVEPSHVLEAMAVDSEVAATAIRVSLGWDSVESDVDRLIDAWGTIYHRAGTASVTSAMAS